jgi:hypothetical protein
MAIHMGSDIPHVQLKKSNSRATFCIKLNGTVELMHMVIL